LIEGWNVRFIFLCINVFIVLLSSRKASQRNFALMLFGGQSYDIFFELQNFF